MGRIRPTPIKRMGKKLFKISRDSFKSDFESNKKSLGSLVEVKSKKLRNVLAGYVTHLVKAEKKGPRKRKRSAPAMQQRSRRPQSRRRPSR